MRGRCPERGRVEPQVGVVRRYWPNPWAWTPRLVPSRAGSAIAAAREKSPSGGLPWIARGFIPVRGGGAEQSFPACARPLTDRGATGRPRPCRTSPCLGCPLRRNGRTPREMRSTERVVDPKPKRGLIPKPRVSEAPPWVQSHRNPSPERAV